MSSIEEQIKVAKEVSYFYHKYQKYGERPYTYHIDQVVNLLKAWKSSGPFEVYDEDIVVGYLHDVLEDSYCTQKEIVDRHGEHIFQRLKLLSRNYSTDKDSYLNNLKGDVVKIADTVCNLKESLKDNNEHRVYKYVKQLCTISSIDFCNTVLSNYISESHSIFDHAVFTLERFKNAN
jgi:(p)ppGpp synthase/HD superfamily hydrolase